MLEGSLARTSLDAIRSAASAVTRNGLTVAAALLTVPIAASAQANSRAPGRYALVNGVKMYYEVHGSGSPLVLLHGAFGTIAGWGKLLPALAQSRQVVAVELQGHGHTCDVDRPLSHRQLAEDVVALLHELKIEHTDVYGYSMGGSVALELGAQHPDLVRKLIVQGTIYNKQGWEPETYEQFLALPPDFAPKVLKDPYDKVAPDPKHWPMLVAKVKQMEVDFNGLSEGDLKAIPADTLIIMGDREGFRLENVVQMYRLIPHAQLAVVPGGDHFLPFTRPDTILALLTNFLGEPIPASAGGTMPERPKK